MTSSAIRASTVLMLMQQINDYAMELRHKKDFDVPATEVMEAFFEGIVCASLEAEKNGYDYEQSEEW